MLSKNRHLQDSLEQTGLESLSLVRKDSEMTTKLELAQEELEQARLQALSNGEYIKSLEQELQSKNENIK